MKSTERKNARELRKKGLSLNEIQKTLHISKSSASTWVRDIALTTIQLNKLKRNSHSKLAVELRRTSRLRNEVGKRDKVIETAKNEVGSSYSDPLFYIGTSLYWGEGTKATKGVVAVDNSDPYVIKVMMRYFREVCHVPEKKMKGYLHIHPHLDFKKAEQYWSKLTGIPLSQFYVTYRVPPKSSQNKKDNLPYGTFRISICDTKLLLRIKGWIQGIQVNLVDGAGIEPAASSV